MSEENHTMDFLNLVHTVTSNADFLIEAYMMTQIFIEEHPGIVPDESATLSKKTVETLVLMRDLIKSLTEHTLEVEDFMDKVKKDIQNKKK